MAPAGKKDEDEIPMMRVISEGGWGMKVDLEEAEGRDKYMGKLYKINRTEARTDEMKLPQKTQMLIPRIIFY